PNGFVTSPGYCLELTADRCNRSCILADVADNEPVPGTGLF
ncbi:MAG: hypothetical protein ACI9BK_001779, partial [Acidimicrobiales bacterium]